MYRFNLSFLQQRRDDWFDPSLKRTLKGPVYAYRFKDPKCGEWLLNVRICKTIGKAIVEGPTSDGVNSIHRQLKRKTNVFNRCRDEKRYYHPIGVTYLEKGRIHYHRITDVVDVPAEIQANFDIARYEDVSPKEPSRSLRGKIVIIAKEDEPEKMALSFVLEKIYPVLGSP